MSLDLCKQLSDHIDALQQGLRRLVSRLIDIEDGCVEPGAVPVNALLTEAVDLLDADPRAQPNKTVRDTMPCPPELEPEHDTDLDLAVVPEEAVANGG